MLNANCLPPFQWRKKKGSLIPTSFFLQQRKNKQYSAQPQQSNQVEEFKKDYKQPPQEKGKQEEEIQTAENQSEELPISPPKINIPPPEGKMISSFSLASIQKKKEWEQKQKPEITDDERPEDTFTLAQLNKHWKAYQNEKSQQKQQNLASLFLLSNPKLIDQKTIEYTVPSSLNKVELEREFVHFLPYLRKALNNFSVEIHIVVNEAEEKNYIYTPEEKYTRLREINPHIDELRKKLDLDL